MSISFENRCRSLVVELGLGKADEVASIVPLTGGVSSDIARITINNREICVKFALEKLKVAEEWVAGVTRNKAEYLWLSFVSSIVPTAVPALLGSSDTLNGFAMEFVDGEGVYLWKTALLAARPAEDEAVKVGNALGLIHHQSSVSQTIGGQFQNSEDFFSLRLEPYLLFTATHHPDLATEMSEIVEMVTNNQFVLVHGDVSPKNILFRHGEPMFLDAECATMGDPGFDVSFCLNHLILKAVHLKTSRDWLLVSVAKLWSSYKSHVSWEDPEDLEGRVVKLLPALMLARVDGKSPVEYLDDVNREIVRSLAIPLIKNPVHSLVEMVERISLALENQTL